MIIDGGANDDDFNIQDEDKMDALEMINHLKMFLKNRVSFSCVFVT